MYEEGNDPDGNGQPDIKKAIKYYEKAIKLGSKEAEVKMAQMYVKGVKGILDANPELAFEMLANQDEPNAEALNILGSLYYSK